MSKRRNTNRGPVHAIGLTLLGAVAFWVAVGMYFL